VLDIYNNPDSSYAEEVTRKFVQADYEHPCGTAMCAAGWIGEVTGVDWVVDATMMSSSARTRDMLTNKAEFILVPKSLGTKVPTLNGHGDYWGNLDGTIKEMLRLRGFTGSTHMLMTVSGWAEYQLGLVNGDFLELFSGNNGLQDIRLLIDLYAEVGPAHNDSTLFDSRDTVVAHIMNMIDKEDRGFVRKMAELHEASPEAPLLDVAREALAYVYDSERVPEAYFRDGLV
jgi:hypothetical protein